MKTFSEYDLYIPLRSNQGTRYPAKLIQGLKKELIDHFGGLTETSFNSKGHWKVGPVTVRDEIRIWRVLQQGAKTGDPFLRGFRSKLEKALKQDQILIVKRAVHVL